MKGTAIKYKQNFVWSRALTYNLSKMGGGPSGNIKNLASIACGINGTRNPHTRYNCYNLLYSVYTNYKKYNRLLNFQRLLTFSFERNKLERDSKLVTIYGVRDKILRQEVE